LPPNPRPIPPTPAAPAARASSEDALRLLFPPPGAVLSEGPVTLRVMGGRRPLTVLVDGTRLPTDPARRDMAWVPPGPGFYRLTVLDADGAVARTAVRVR
jgi:penicillin-binding protein 1C